MSDDVTKYLALRRYAVVGASRRPEKYGYKVMKNLLERGKTVFPVNPGVSEIDGIRCYPAIRDIPEKPEAVHIITQPEVTERVARDCVDIGVRYVWMQPGAESDTAIALLKKHGVTVIYDRCVLVQL